MSDLSGKKTWIAVVVALLVYAILLGVTFALGSWVDERKLGVVGDYFGGLANIVAMAGVVVALVMQMRELALQRRELSLTRDELRAQREEMAKQAAALDAQLRATRETDRFRHLLELHRFQLDPGFRHARGVLMGLANSSLEEWGADAREEAEKACAHWNFIGLLVIEGVLPRSMIGDIRNSLIRCHDAAKELLAEVRKERGDDHWQHFTMLAEQVGAGK